MSDIAIRFDGLLFACVIAASGVLLLLVALGFAVHGHWAQTSKARSKSIARACALGCLACLASFAALVFYMETAGTPMSGPDWLDWITLPWLAIMLGGLVRLSRTPAR
jgi:protein-S-isoprenylcysteine O-methyltransferase Ste14